MHAQADAVQRVVQAVGVATARTAPRRTRAQSATRKDRRGKHDDLAGPVIRPCPGSTDQRAPRVHRLMMRLDTCRASSPPRTQIVVVVQVDGGVAVAGDQPDRVAEGGQRGAARVRSTPCSSPPLKNSRLSPARAPEAGLSRWHGFCARRRTTAWVAPKLMTWLLRKRACSKRGWAGSASLRA
jgi:hypothetical protein